MQKNRKFYFECVNCHSIYEETQVNYLCPACKNENDNDVPPKGVLKTLYNYNSLINDNTTFNSLKANSYLDLLPINSIQSLGYLKVGNTPLYKINRLGKEELNYGLYLKDDSQNPTFSFKDRASIIISALAKEKNISTIVAASTGNAGSSLAGICASQNQKAIILVPSSAPIAKLTQVLMYGAVLVPVDGNYDTAFELSIKISEKYGWYNRNTAFNPFTIEGKKTVSFEIYDQFNRTLPDMIFVPVGDGVIISGVYKGFEDLLKLKIINKIPKIIAVQSNRSSNFIDNLKTKFWITKPSDTIADSISVDIPRNFYMAKNFIEEYDGEYIKVDDEDILNSSKFLASSTGIFAEPAACTAFAGMLKYRENNKFDSNSKILVLLTGSGLKDIKSVSSYIKMPKPIKADIESISNFLSAL
jgi:threonine synthase